MKSILAWIGLWAALAWAHPRALAVGGVGDTTVIVGDTTDLWKWPRELAQWTSLIENTTQQIRRADELIRIAGDPQKLVHELVESVPELMEPVEEAVSLETRQDALRLSKALYSLGSVAIKTYNDANKVGPNYEAFGETLKHDARRFAHLSAQEAMYARYKKAVENAEAVEKKELQVQRKALEDLNVAQTQAELEICDRRLTASKQRQDLVHQKAMQAKAELDAFRGQLRYEEAWKAEADREWAQAVIDRMRAKALAAYRAQVRGGTGNGGDE